MISCNLSKRQAQEMQATMNDQTENTYQAFAATAHHSPS